MKITTQRYAGYDDYTKGVVVERELVYTQILKESRLRAEECHLLEIGAGHGVNVRFFKEMGVLEQNCTLIEPDRERCAALRRSFPIAAIENVPFSGAKIKEKFDIILVSLVLSSILEDDVREHLFIGALEVLKPKGRLIVYDFKYDNPNNNNVRAVSPTTLRGLLPPDFGSRDWNVSIAPPIGRKVGKWYKTFNSILPFLRTHFIMDISLDNS